MIFFQVLIFYTMLNFVHVLNHHCFKCSYPNGLERRVVIEGSLEVKLPTIWTDEKQMKNRAGKSQRREEQKKEKASEERRSRCVKR